MNTPDENTTDHPDNNSSGLSAKPPAPISTYHGKERRGASRIYTRWKADVFINGQEPYHGFIKDISLTGTAVFIDRNLQNVRSVKLRLHVPRINTTSAPHIIEVSGKIIYPVYDGTEFLFRIGVNFTRFNLESDRVYLQSLIENQSKKH